MSPEGPPRPGPEDVKEEGEKLETATTEGQEASVEITKEEYGRMREEWNRAVEEEKRLQDEYEQTVDELNVMDDDLRAVNGEWNAWKVAHADADPNEFKRKGEEYDAVWREKSPLRENLYHKLEAIQARRRTVSSRLDVLEKQKDKYRKQERERFECEEKELKENSFGNRLHKAVGEFWRRQFKGELGKDDEKKEITKKDIAKGIGASLVGVAATLSGVKLIADLPRWLVQKYYTKQEQKRLTQAFEGAAKQEYKKGESATVEVEQPPLPLVGEKAAALDAAIDSSKYLSEDKKAELKARLRGIQTEYVASAEKHEKGRNEAVAKLLDEAIQTRVKATTVAKEAMNSTLMFTGLATLRGLGYGAVALVERAQRVKKEMEKGERKGTFGRELIVNGFTETWNALQWKGEKGKKEKAKDLAKAIGTVARFAGFAGLAVGELSGGRLSRALDEALDALEKKSLSDFAGDNFVENFHRGTFGFLRGEKAAAVPEEVEQPEAPEEAPPTGAPEEVPEEPEQAPEPPQEPAPDAGTEPEPEAVPEPEAKIPPQVPEASPEAIRPAHGATESGAAHESAAEAAVKVEELSHEAMVETGKVISGDGITQAAMRDLVEMGYPEDEETRRLLRKMAKESGLLDTWLSEKAIGNLSVGVAEHDGKMQFEFYDAHTGATIPKDELGKLGFLMKPIEDVKHADVLVSESEERMRELGLARDILGPEKFAQLSTEERQEMGDLLQKIEKAQWGIKLGVQKGNERLREAMEEQFKMSRDALTSRYGNVLPHSWFKDLARHDLGFGGQEERVLAGVEKTHGAVASAKQFVTSAEAASVVPETASPQIPTNVREVQTYLESQGKSGDGAANVGGIIFRKQGTEISFRIPGIHQEIPLNSKTENLLKEYQQLLNTGGEPSSQALQTFRRTVETTLAPLAEVPPAPPSRS